MTDDDFSSGSGAAVEAAAAEPLDDADARLLAEVAALLTVVDPIPDDLVDRLRFSLAWVEVDAELASLTRMAGDALAVRSESAPSTRTETLTFSSTSLTAMVTVSRPGTGAVRLDGWLAPPAPLRVQVRMQEGASQDVAADEAGRFVVDRLPEGFAQLCFHLAEQSGDDEAGVVITPVFQL